MPSIRSPKHKLLIACALIGCLALAARATRVDASIAARGILAAAALVGLVIWLQRAKAGATAPTAPRLRVLSRASLSQRCGIALVEADGRGYLVAFGDGFAQLHEAPVAGMDASRPPRRGTRAALKGGRG
jgi:flagellar protein FliO/FliZ